MITIEKATELVFSRLRNFGTEILPLEKSLGRVLKQPLIADRDLPPFDRVTMDGIAILFEKYQNGQRRFKIEATQAAGDPQGRLQNPDNCIEIMTGASLTKGVDTVIRYEDVTIENGFAVIHEVVKPQQNIHFKGEDRKAGSLVVQANQIINAPVIGVAAATGFTKLTVNRLPRIVLISTGDELVEIKEEPLPHQIRQSNTPTLGALLEQTFGITPEHRHINDDEAGTYAALTTCLKEFDILILTGGVSKGKFDYVPAALEKLGVEKLFHRVKQRPGKPFWFGEQQGGAVVFALPGNPASSFMCTNRYILPWLRLCFELSPFEENYAALDTDFTFKPELQYFLQAELYFDKNGQQWAKPLIGKGSGDFSNLVVTQCFLELPAEQTLFKKGETFRVFKY